MENEILLALKHIKEISKKKVTLAKIESFAKKNKIDITTDELNKVTESMVNNSVIQRQGESKTFDFPSNLKIML